MRDFAPYIAKIKASGADTVITGNWGSDLALLVKAANEAGYNGKFFTYYAGVTGTPTAMGSTRRGPRVPGRLRPLQHGRPDATPGLKEFKQKFNDDFYTGSIIRMPTSCCRNAMAKAKSTDPVKVAAAHGGHEGQERFSGEVEMRKTDHQLQQPLYITVWQKADAKYPYSPENTGMTLAPVAEYPNLRVEHADAAAR